MGNHSKQLPKQNVQVLSSIVNYLGRTMPYIHQIKWLSQSPFFQQPENSQIPKQCYNYIIHSYSHIYIIVIQLGETHQILPCGRFSGTKRLHLESSRTPQTNPQLLTSATKILFFDYPISTKIPSVFLCLNTKTNYYLISFKTFLHRMTCFIPVQPGMPLN